MASCLSDQERVQLYYCYLKSMGQGSPIEELTLCQPRHIRLQKPVKYPTKSEARCVLNNR
jgi:hypothetical protein